MNNILVIHKANTPVARDQAQELRGWLEARGKAVTVREAQGGEPAAQGAADEAALPAQADLAVVMGGDGTMLGAVRDMVAAGLERTPILGVNLGGLGFLTAVSSEEMLPAMERALQGRFEAPPRMMLRAEVRRDGRAVAQFVALNDLVINKAALARIIELHLDVDQRHLTTFRADGLIVATPTGSTAYNLSAGGPICHPELDCVLVTPICSFALSNRPLLLGPFMVLRVAMGERAAQTTLTCDGQVGLELQPADEIIIGRAAKTVRVIQSPFKDYYQILRTKLRWG